MIKVHRWISAVEASSASIKANVPNIMKVSYEVVDLLRERLPLGGAPSRPDEEEGPKPGNKPPVPLLLTGRGSKGGNSEPCPPEDL